MEKRILDYVLVPSGLVVMVSYHVWLLYRILKHPNNTIIGINAVNRRFWVRAMMEVRTSHPWFLLFISSFCHIILINLFTRMSLWYSDIYHICIILLAARKWQIYSQRWCNEYIFLYLLAFVGCVQKWCFGCTDTEKQYNGIDPIGLHSNNA